MARRRSFRRKQAAVQAVSNGGEPPGPITGTIIASLIGGAAAIGASAIGRGKKPKTPAAPEAPESPLSEPKKATNPNLINTSPQGVLTEQNSARKTLLGG